ncbi:MAG: radical SAM protein, partial [Bacteroidota bacterium]
PKILVIYDDQFNYLTKMCLGRMRKAAFAMTHLAKERNCTVVVFSSDASDHLEEYFAAGADYVLRGEAEETLVQLCTNLLAHEPGSVEKIDGLAFRVEGRTCTTPKRKVATDLDSFPFPAWDLLDLGLYRRAWTKRHGYFSLNMVTTRGCPFHCNWCAKPIYGQVYHSRSPENVVEEMLHLKSLAQPDHLWFADDIFGLKPGWVARFDQVVNERGANIPFKCLSRVDLLLQEDTIRHLHHAGCQTVWVGAESGSQKILDAMEKGTRVEEIYRATALLRESGIRIGFFLQYGYPGETRKDIEQTLRMVKDCRPDEIGISVSYPLPGTKFHDRVKEDLQKKQNWVDSGDLDMMFHGTYAPDFYRALHLVTHKKFRLWQAGEAFRHVLIHPQTVNRKSLRLFAASAYHAFTLPRLESQLRLLAEQRNPVVHGE